MGQTEPKTTTMNATEVQENWSDILTTVARGQQRIVLEENGKARVALVSAADLEQLQFYEAKRAEAFAVLDEMRAAFADVPDEELQREVERAIAEVRAERRAAEQAAAPA